MESKAAALDPASAKSTKAVQAVMSSILQAVSQSQYTIGNADALVIFLLAEGGGWRSLLKWRKLLKQCVV